MTVLARIRLKNACSHYAEYGANIPSEAYVDEQDGIRFVRTTDISEDGALKAASEGVFVPPNLARSSRAILRDGDILLSRSGTIGRSFIYDRLRHGPCSFAGYLVRFTPRIGFDSRYIFYWTKTAEFQVQIAQSSIQTTIQNFNGQKYACMSLPAPSEGTQIRIADFLDRKTAAIDALIGKKERLIELLEEKRQALITRAVTKGLDPNVPMKDSGIEWLGEIPAHWCALRLADISTRLGNGYVGPTRDILVDAGIRYLQSLHIKDNEVRFTPEYHVAPEWAANKRKATLRADDVVIVQTGDIGQVAHIPGLIREVRGSA